MHNCLSIYFPLQPCQFHFFFFLSKAWRVRFLQSRNTSNFIFSDEFHFENTRQIKRLIWIECSITTQAIYHSQILLIFPYKFMEFNQRPNIKTQLHSPKIITRASTFPKMMKPRTISNNNLSIIHRRKHLRKIMTINANPQILRHSQFRPRWRH